MADTYTLISSVTVGAGGAASIDFTSIPGTYTDLLLRISARTTNANFYDSMGISFNNTGTGVTFKRLQGNGQVTSSGTTMGNALVGDTATASTFGNQDIYITNYAGSNYKSFSMDSVGENNATGAIAILDAGLWSDTTAINRITITCGNSFKQYSTAYLYGIKNS